MKQAVIDFVLFGLSVLGAYYSFRRGKKLLKDAKYFRRAPLLDGIDLQVFEPEMEDPWPAVRSRWPVDGRVKRHNLELHIDAKRLAYAALAKKRARSYRVTSEVSLMGLSVFLGVQLPTFLPSIWELSKNNKIFADELAGFRAIGALFATQWPFLSTIIGLMYAFSLRFYADKLEVLASRYLSYSPPMLVISPP